ncbi:MAG: replicative DNA helicase [Enterobacterales bacterium]
MFEFNNIEKKIKILPHSIEAEQSVLGGLMLENDRWDDISDKLNSDDFFNNSNKIIFNEIKLLSDIGKPIDLITLSESLDKKNKLEFIGGFSYLAELSKNIPSAANIFAYADIVRECSIIREIILLSHKISNAGYNRKYSSSEDLIDFAESLLFKISDTRNCRNMNLKSIDVIIENTLNKIKFLYKNKKNITGISSGYTDLDNKTSGFQNSDLIIIASRPSMGKTTLAMNLCENISINEKKPVLIFSLEMSSEQIIMKMISSQSRIYQSKIRTGKLNINDWNKISNSIDLFSKKRNIYIDDSSSLTPFEIRSRSRRIFRENNGLSLIMIDYLQLIKIPSLSENRTLEITEISRALKSLAKELNIPIIALSQLNRNLEQRADKRPINSDLRDSGSIEQDADIVMFIYRDEIYNINSNSKGIAEIILSKQRNGPIGTIKLIFNGKISRFDNYTSLSYNN